MPSFVILSVNTKTSHVITYILSLNMSSYLHVYLIAIYIHVPHNTINKYGYENKANVLMTTKYIICHM